MRNRPWKSKRLVVAGLIGATVVLALLISSRVQANSQLFQTIPTPTPRTQPAPTGAGQAPQTAEGTGMVSRLVVRQQMDHQDVMAGEILRIGLEITNVSAETATGVLLTNRLDAGLQPLEVRATQGAATVQGELVYIDVGTLDAGQTVLAIIETQVDPAAKNGQIILNEVTADFEGMQVAAEPVAAGLPPLELPATGRDWRAP